MDTLPSLLLDSGVLGGEVAFSVSLESLRDFSVRTQPSERWERAAVLLGLWPDVCRLQWLAPRHPGPWRRGGHVHTALPRP